MDENSKLVVAFKNFKNSKAALPVTLVIATLLEVLLFYFGIEVALCGLGFPLVAAVAYLVLKRLTKADFKQMLICAIVMFIVVTMVGTFIVSPSFIGSCTSVDDFKNDNIDVLETTATDTTFTITFHYKPETDWEYNKIKVTCAPVNALCYMNMSGQNGDQYIKEVSIDGENDYTVTFDSFDKNKLHVCQFALFKDDKADRVTGMSLYKEGVTNNTIYATAITFTALYVGVTMIFFIIIAFFVQRASKSLNNTRSQMEAEGRLYPKGYGRCKQCGTIVLPGEEYCRKCGAYIDVPEEFKRKRTFQCSDCGAEVPEDATICPNCGAKFDEDENDEKKE